MVAEIEDLEPAELEELERVFDREIFPVLTPLAVGPGQPFPYISGLSLSLGLFVRDPETGEERFARVKVPELLPRFLPIGSRGLFVPLERVIRHFLAWLFPMMEIVECTTFRVTRDADFSVSDEADDLLEAVELELRRRPFGDPVRLEISGSCSTRMLQQLKDGLDVVEEQVYLVPGLLDLSELHELVALERPELKEDPWVPVVPARFASGDREALFAELRKSPVLVHHPYDSFARTFEWFVRTAATDPKTVAVKTTVYRTSDDSPHVPALIEAAEEGKQTVCLVELKARFDERRNIEWSREARVGGRPRRLRLPVAEDPRQGHADRAARGRRRAAALRAHRHRELQRGHGAALRGLQPLHGRRGDHRRPGRPLQLPDRVRPPARLPQAAGGAVHDADRRWSSTSAPARPRPRRASRRGSGSRSTTSPTRRS